MSVAEQVCRECGAINHLDADICWRCRTSLAAEPAPTAEAVEPSPTSR